MEQINVAAALLGGGPSISASVSSWFWPAVTRLGESFLLLPLAAVLASWLLWREPAARPSVRRWLLLLGAAAGLTTLSKLAFMGWGIGSARWDFTGISGHAMCASAVLPVLARGLAGVRPRWQTRTAVLLGYALALLVAVSRLQVQAHSVSEVIAGLLVGGTASLLALAVWPGWRLPVWLWLLPLGVLLGAPHAPPSPVHGALIQTALKLSGRPQPYTRQALQQRGRRWGRPPPARQLPMRPPRQLLSRPVASSARSLTPELGLRR